jgi:hypothetical protein
VSDVNTFRERRASERYRGNLDAKWEGILARQSGSLVDISIGGCFILSPDDVQLQELIRLEIKTPTGRAIYLWGEVVYKAPEMGFAIRFTGSDSTETEMLKLLLDYLRDEQGEESSAPLSHARI